jgi:pyruvate formate lyase activating enzyme
MSASAVLDRVEEDAVFYQRSGGGLTLSGGEPLSQGGFALEILREAARRRVDASLETAGAVAEKTLLAAAGLTGSVIYDLKHWDPVILSRTVGGDGALPARNLRALRAALPEAVIRVRIPVIPGFNGSLPDLLKTASLVPEGLAPPELLPFHRLGEAKYALLGREPPFRAEPWPPDRFAGLVRAFREALGCGARPGAGGRPPGDGGAPPGRRGFQG